MNKPLKGFITYSHKDDLKRKKLRTYLTVMEKEGEIKLWDDTDITAGGNACQEHILKEVAGSDILLYLVSADSLASENCNKELTEAVKRKRKIFPIILENCDWRHDRLRNFQALPNKGKPINKWEPESDGWQNVVDGIRNAVKEILSQVELTFQQGNAFMMITQPDMAIERYSYAIELDPNFGPAYFNRGIAYEEKKEYDKAIRDFTEAIELSPDSVVRASSYASRGGAYMHKKEYDKAFKDFTEAIKLNPTNNYGLRGSAYNRIGEYDKAIGDLSRAIELNPDRANPYAYRGFAYNHKGEYDKAILDCNKAIKLDPKNNSAYVNRGIARLHLEEWESARSDLTTAKNMGMDIINVFHDDYASITNFEQTTGIQLPSDITTLLTTP